MARAVERAIDDEQRWDLIESAIGAVPDDGSLDWDADPGAWVRSGRRADARRVG